MTCVSRVPPRQGLYDPTFEHDACGLGFVASLVGRQSHDVIEQALRVLVNLQHRGACAADDTTGDGAGILIQMPHAFLRSVVAPLGIDLPAPGSYGAGLVFLPRNPARRASLRQRCEAIVHDQGAVTLGWRPLDIDDTQLGRAAAASRPVIEQLFVGLPTLEKAPDPLAVERRLYVIRRRLERTCEAARATTEDGIYLASLSSRVLVYKGMLRADQIGPVFTDLRDPRLHSALALVHQRFSTNTFPSWPLAHPFRLLAHNGEINTLRGNVNWMRAREGLLRSPLFGRALADVLPVIAPGGSDSATFDNVLELLVLAGRSLPHALLMMVPPPWSSDHEMSPSLRAFYEYHSMFMEPWDGPAVLAFTDGTQIGAMLDRNGLRPARYCVTRDDVVVLASEAGVLDLPPASIVRQGRVPPGEIFLVDTAAGRIVTDDEIKRDLAATHPYADWVAHSIVDVDALHAPPAPPTPDRTTVLRRQQMFGYTQEDHELLLAPMAEAGKEPVGSMGSDSALAILSERPRLLFDYFKQMFAQVTNPPLDAVREQAMTTMVSTIGPEGNLLDPSPAGRAQIRVASPILDNAQLARIRATDRPGLRAVTLPILFAPSDRALEPAIGALQRQAADAVRAGSTLLILSDRQASAEQMPIPSLLATAAVHRHLVDLGLRTGCGLVVECGDAREVHHCALLLGYGAGAVNPYLALETVVGMVDDGRLAEDSSEATRRYMAAVHDGVLKVMSKMGISTLQSYCGAQIFQAIGLSASLIDHYFPGTSSPLGGLDLEGVAREVRARHRRAWRAQPRNVSDLDVGGEYHWRRDGEVHLFTPETVFKLQHATRSRQYDIFKEYTTLVDDQTRRGATIRGLLTLESAGPTLPLDAVEPAETLVQRFATGAMSYGSISAEAHETLAVAMNRLGGRSNSGEGGEDPSRYQCATSGESRRSAVKQIASGRFGVTSEYLVNADELQIKMSQGAKPGEGGQLPGAKVYPWIARVRHATPGVGLISPPPHHDIYSIEDLAQLILDLRCANPRARISVKLVAAAGVGTIAAGVVKAGADVILISGHDGGTGAAPLTSIKHAGVPWELGLAEAQQVLRLNDLRGRVKLQTDGQLKTGRDVVIAALLGAEEFGFATAPLVVSGCVMMRVCHLNTCPVGIATQDPALRARYAGRPEFITTFFHYIAEEVREYMAALGFRTFDEMVGRADCLKPRASVDGWKAKTLDLSPVLYIPETAAQSPRRSVQRQPDVLRSTLDAELLEECRQAIDSGESVTLRRRVRNVHRSIGTMIGAAITRRWGGSGLPDGRVELRCSGSAGQSFGAFIPRGLTLVLEGEANDHVGKGLSGGRIVIMPPDAASPRDGDVIVGNVVLYGATSGDIFIRGVAGERFAVRNSGATAVVEGVGDHGCEYMTGGRVVIIGATGRNFAAGMSGGVAWVFDEGGQFRRRCNPGMVDLEALLPTDEDESVVRALVQHHAALTGSPRAEALLRGWRAALPAFVRVMPRELKAATIPSTTGARADSGGAAMVTYG
jgi:glutamate synthase (NADPH/NADH) large chain